MNKILTLSLALGGAVSLSACETPQQQNALVATARSGRGRRQPSSVRRCRGGSAGGALAGRRRGRRFQGPDPLGNDAIRATTA